MNHIGIKKMAETLTSAQPGEADEQEASSFSSVPWRI